MAVEKRLEGRRTDGEVKKYIKDLEGLFKLASKPRDPKVDMDLELMNSIREAFERAKEEGYKGDIDQFIKDSPIKDLKEIGNYKDGGPVVDFTGLDIPTMKAIFRSENGRDAKSPKELIKGIKMYFKNMNLDGRPFGVFE